MYSEVHETKFKVYQPELLEPVSAGEVFEADNELSICINFSLLMCNGV